MVISATVHNSGDLALSGVKVRITDGGAFTVIDAAARSFAQGQHVFARALGRDEVIATPLAATVYRLVDAIWLGDTRIDEVRAPGSCG